METSIKNYIVFFILLSACWQLNGQNWAVSQTIKGSQIEPRFSAIDGNNNTVILAQFADTILAPFDLVSYGSNDLVICKINPNGVIQWLKRIGNTANDIAGGITIDNNDDIYVSGTFSSPCRFTTVDSLISTGSTDVYIAKYNANGVFQWAKTVASSSTFQSASDLKFDGNNRLLSCGFFRDSIILGNPATVSDTLLGNAYFSHYIAVFDVTAELLWSERFLGTNNLIRFKSVDLSTNGYYYGGFYRGDLILDIGTISSYDPSAFDAFIYKTDLNGNGQWVRRIRGPATENFRTLTTDEYDNVYVLGNYNSTFVEVDSTATITNTYTGNSGGYDTFIGKYNRSGVLQWFLRKGSTANDIYNDFVIRNNLIYSTGYFANEIIFNQDTLRTDDPLNEDPFLAALNEIGDPISGVSIEGTGNYNDAGSVVNMGDASRAYVSGYYKSQQIQIGEEIYTSDNVNESDLFFAIYEHPFTAVITDERNVSCNGLSDGMLEVTPYFGKPPYTYDWSHNPSLDSPVADDLPAGPYSVTITDDNSQTAFVSTSVSEPDPIVITETITDVSCYNGDDGAIDIAVTGGTVSGDYNYSWSTLDGSGIEPTAQNQSGLTSGNYNVVVKDDNLCSETEDYEVTQPGKIIYAGSVVTDITIPPGNNGAVDLSVSGGNEPYDYEWTGPSGFYATTEDISGLGTAGLYHIGITDDEDCTSDTSFTVSDNFTMIAQVTNKTDVTCFGYNDGTATVTVTNGQSPFTYDWSDIGPIANAYRSGMAPGHYVVTVTDALFNTAVDSVDIFGPSSALVLTLNPQDLKCYNDNSGVVDLTVSGGTLPYSYDWSNGYTGEDLVNVGKDLYTVEVTDGFGCTAQDNAYVDEPDPIVLDIDLFGINYCPGDNLVMATADASGGFGSFEYLWDDPGAQVTETAYDLGAGYYTVIVTDMNGCQENESVLVTEPDAFVLTQVDYIEPTCSGDSDGSIIPWIEGGTGGYDYVWSNNVFQRINSNIPADVYTLSITDANNCPFESEFILNEPDSVKVTAVETTDPTCSGRPDGAIEISAEGGTGNLQYSVDDGSNYIADSVFTSLAQGYYTIKVQDENNCESEAYPVTLTKPGTCKMVLYDAFSPNGDEYNEVWNIGNIDNYPQCIVKIYNTWGTLVFSSEGYGMPWDGTYNGKELPSGTYYYVIDPGDGSDILTGPVSIVK